MAVRLAREEGLFAGISAGANVVASARIAQELGPGRKVVTMLPDQHMAEVEAADYNRQTLAEAERVRDFLAAHYRTARRAEPMWRAVAQAVPPPSLDDLSDRIERAVTPTRWDLFFGVSLILLVLEATPT